MKIKPGTLLYECNNHYITVNARGDYEVYRNEGVAAVRRALIGRTFPNAFERAKNECHRREGK